MPSTHAEQAPPSTDPRIPDFRIGKLKPNHEGFGRVVDFLSRIEPFSHFLLGSIAVMIRHQLKHRDHLAAMSGRDLVGYMGWIPTTETIAEAWSRDEGPLRPIYDSSADAWGLGVVAAPHRPVVIGLLREALKEGIKRGPGTRVYYKREYQGNAHPARKSYFELPDGDDSLGLPEILFGVLGR